LMQDIVAFVSVTDGKNLRRYAREAVKPTPGSIQLHSQYVVIIELACIKFALCTKLLSMQFKCCLVVLPVLCCDICTVIIVCALMPNK